MSDFPQDTAFAVRSSGSDEDSGDSSFAGQQDTFLNVVGIEDLVKAVRNCWSSMGSEAATVYRATHAVNDDATMAVVTQQMVDAQCAGVMFTQHPVRSDVDRIVVEVVAGLGEALVSGEVTPDRIEMGRGGSVVVSEIDSPEGKENFDMLVDVDFNDLSNKLEGYFGVPQDIE